MRTAGHKILRAHQLERGQIKVTLECSCGKVFNTAFCKPEDTSVTLEAVYAESQLDAARHIATMDELVKTVVAGQPCAA